MTAAQYVTTAEFRSTPPCGRRHPVLRLIAATPWGAPRLEWEVDEALDLDVPSMLAGIWDRPHSGRYVSRFGRDVRIDRGVLRFEGGGFPYA